MPVLWVHVDKGKSYNIRMPSRRITQPYRLDVLNFLEAAGLFVVSLTLNAFLLFFLPKVRGALQRSAACRWD